MAVRGPDLHVAGATPRQRPAGPLRCWLDARSRSDLRIADEGGTGTPDEGPPVTHGDELAVHPVHVMKRALRGPIVAGPHGHVGALEDDPEEAHRHELVAVPRHIEERQVRPRI